MDIKKSAEVLIQAIPYITKFAGRTIVIKYGGNAMINEELKNIVMEDLALLQLLGIRIVLVHGGGPDISDMLNRLQMESMFKNGLRVTDRETAAVAQMVLAGKVNKGLVQLFHEKGGKGIGISGLDNGMIQAEPLQPELGYVGKIAGIDDTVLRDCMDSGYITFVATVGTGKDGAVFNINADTVAAAIAAKLKAAKLILLTDVPGLMMDPADPESLISELFVSDVALLKTEGVIRGGMIPKVDCCVEAIREGVRRAHIIDGRVPHAILLELLSDTGIGTMLLSH
ncbi:MAG: acetylglutamate kinase [Eubacteriales bacterium]|nr:acetylglutamate kinase [Eubacteriales bacterium]